MSTSFLEVDAVHALEDASVKAEVFEAEIRFCREVGFRELPLAEHRSMTSLLAWRDTGGEY